MVDRRPRLLFHFLHLLGVGHVHRAQRLIEAFKKEGIAVDVIYGGMPLDGITFAAESVHHLPPIRAEDATYKNLLDADGDRLSQAWLEKRTDKLLDIFSRLSPDAILTEAFPFGRRIIRHEIDALLNAANQRDTPPLIVSSVRDILQENRKPGRIEEARDWVRDRFDHVLVHADPNIISLQATFQLAPEIEEKLSYSGFVVPPPQEGTVAGEFDRIVSAGGGGFGGDLMQTALEFANGDTNHRWCLATGPNFHEGSAEALREAAASHVNVVERLDNLSEHMKKAQVSISQCGYNTAMDVLAAHQTSDCRAVFVPHDITGQTEQLRRAYLLEKAGYAITIPQSELTVEALKSAVERATASPKVERQIDFDGAPNSAKLLRGWIEERR